MANWYYLILFIVSVLLSYAFVLKLHKHTAVHFSLIYLLIPFVNMSFYLLSVSNTIEEAVLANKMCYFGSTFLIFYVNLYIVDFCHIKVNKWLKLFLFAFSSLIVGMALTIGRATIFYKSYDYKIVNGAAYIVDKQYGFGHTLYYLMLIGYILFGLVAITYAFRMKKDVSRRMLVILSSSSIFSILVFIFGRLITDKMEFMPLAYVFSQIIFLIIIQRFYQYDVVDSGIDAIVEKGNTGFISFDFKYRYMGSNSTAKFIIPKINDYYVDMEIPYEDEGLLIKSWLDSFEVDNKENKFHFKSNDMVFLVTVNYLYIGKKKRGYQLLLTDDTKNQRYIELLDKYNKDLKDEVVKKTHGIIELHDKLVLGMAQMVEGRDNSTGGHIKRTSDVIKILTDEIKKNNKLNLSEEFLNDLVKAAPMHDIGKITIDDAILRKPGKFTDDEYEIMKTHAYEGAKILKKILENTSDENFFKIACNVAHYHHERMDGSGYPEHLRGNEIPFEARIMAIADVYDALVSKRVYKEKMSFEEADKIIMDGMGKHFDENLKEYYISARPMLEEYYKNAE